MKSDEALAPKHKRNDPEPSPRILAERERRRLEKERRAQVPSELDPITRKIDRARYADIWKAALGTIFDVRLGDDAFRKLCAAWVAADARNGRGAAFVEIDDLPFDDFPRLWIFREDAAAYQARQQFLKDGREAETAGIVTALGWPPMSTALAADAGYTLWRCTAQPVRTVLLTDTPGTYIYVTMQAGRNILPAAFYERFLNRPDIDQAIEEGRLRRV
jgi:hypothetical protein